MHENEVLNMNDQELFEANGITLSPLQLQQLHTYAQLLVEWNEKFNLTAITEMHEIYVKHFLDSILLAKNYHTAGSLCDVGTGAGFPGLVLKIYQPQLQVTLLEPNGKRVSFLNAVISQLQLEGIETVNQRAEDFAKERFETYDFVTARAVASLNVLAELCLPLTKVHGHFLAMKGPKAYQELAEAEKAIQTLSAQTNSIQAFGLGDDQTRVIIDIKKIDHTPKKYPRNYGQIKKKPL